MMIIDKNLRELRESLIHLRTSCNASDYPTEFQTYDEAWDNLRQSLDHLHGKLGVSRHAQLQDMAAQAKAHYDAGFAKMPEAGARPAPGEPAFEDIKLGSWLMQDMEQVVRGNPPFAYPEELYRWPKS